MTGPLVEKPDGYYGHARLALTHFIREGPNRILDVGCGEGRTGAALKAAGRASEVVGIEKNASVAAVAGANVDRVICTDVESFELPFGPAYFDYIILADVLEHLVDPWTVVEKLAGLLHAGGYMIASIPNVRHWRVVLALLVSGDWRYDPDGVLDDTHLRFFTKKSMRKLFPAPALVVERVVPSFTFSPASRAWRANRLTFRLFEDFLTVRYIMAIRKV